MTQIKKRIFCCMRKLNSGVTRHNIRKRSKKRFNIRSDSEPKTVELLLKGLRKQLLVKKLSSVNLFFSSPFFNQRGSNSPQGVGKSLIGQRTKSYGTWCVDPLILLHFYFPFKKRKCCLFLFGYRDLPLLLAYNMMSR